MSIDAEAIADRRRLRRKLSFWRVLGFSGLIAAVVTAVVAARPMSRDIARAAHGAESQCGDGRNGQQGFA